MATYPEKEALQKRPIPLIARPEPVVTAGNADFFAGIAVGELRLQFCSSCKRYAFVPRERCPYCWSKIGFLWRRTTGRGEIDSYTIVHRPYHKLFSALVPIIFVAIKLAEGPTMLGELWDVQLKDVTIGMRVRAMYQQPNDTDTVGTPKIAVPMWVPDQE